MDLEDENGKPLPVPPAACGCGVPYVVGSVPDSNPEVVVIDKPCGHSWPHALSFFLRPSGKVARKGGMVEG